MKQKLIIDTDPGIDDALAILLIEASKKFEIMALTVVAGNNRIEDVTNNTGYIKKLAGLNAPIYSGATKPLKKKQVLANVHGNSGLSGIIIKEKVELTNNAPEKIIELVKKYPHEIKIMAIGPLTNLAIAFRKAPEIINLVKEIVIMGGTIQAPGNKSRVAEFNIFVDPDAAKNVFDTSIKKTLIPLDVCNKTPLFMKDFNQLKESKYGSFIIKTMKNYIKAIKKFEKMNGALVYDALAAYYLVNPKPFNLIDMDVRVETKGEYTNGMTVADLTPWGEKEMNFSVAMDLNREIFSREYIKIMTKA